MDTKEEKKTIFCFKKRGIENHDKLKKLDNSVRKNERKKSGQRNNNNRL